MLAFSLIFKIISCCVMPNHHLKKMIEQTELIVSKWEYNPPLNFIELDNSPVSVKFNGGLYSHLLTISSVCSIIFLR